MQDRYRLSFRGGYITGTLSAQAGGSRSCHHPCLDRTAIAQSRPARTHESHRPGTQTITPRKISSALLAVAEPDWPWLGRHGADRRRARTGKP
jgi:hypothetical protein